MSKLILIFSHQIIPEQKEDAINNLGVNEFLTLPERLKNIWSNIPPDVCSIKEIVRPIINWVKNNSSEGDYILIQGDFGATFYLILWSIEKGLIPIYSTTKRASKEIINDNGGVEMVKTFQHVRFRKYEKI